MPCQPLRELPAAAAAGGKWGVRQLHAQRLAAHATQSGYAQQTIARTTAACGPACIMPPPPPQRSQRRQQACGMRMQHQLKHVLLPFLDLFPPLLYMSSQ